MTTPAGATAAIPTLSAKAAAKRSGIIGKLVGRRDGRCHSRGIMLPRQASKKEVSGAIPTAEMAPDTFSIPRSSRQDREDPQRKLTKVQNVYHPVVVGIKRRNVIRRAKDRCREHAEIGDVHMPVPI